jgi:hypothetical protein
MTMRPVQGLCGARGILRGFLTTLFTLWIVKVELWWFCKGLFLLSLLWGLDCWLSEVAVRHYIGDLVWFILVRSWVHSQLFLFVKGISLFKADGHNIWPRLMAGAEFWDRSRVFSQLNWQAGDMRPQWTSTNQPTIYWMPLITQLWMDLNWVNIWFHPGGQFCRK